MAKLKQDFIKEDPWRIFRIMSEFVDGIEGLSDIKNAVSIFGSARTKPGNKYYKLAEETASRLVKAGYSVITGAGNGIMEAGNKGAKKAKGISIGLNILIPINQKPNKYITRLIDFKYFFCRKVMFTKYSKAFIVFPGGYGTLDELFEALSLVQTLRVDSFPVILVGGDYWRGLISWIKSSLLKSGAISKSELGIFTLIDNPKKIVPFIENFYNQRI